MPWSLGRKTYEGLAAVWPTLADDPVMGRFAKRINAMPKYVASRTLTGPLEWNATLLEGDISDSVRALKDESAAHLLVSQGGEFAHSLINADLVDEFWFWVNPTLWPSGPRIFEGIGPVKLDLVAATPFQSASSGSATAPRPIPERDAGPCCPSLSPKAMMSGVVF